MSSSRRRVVLAVCGRPAESGSKRAHRKEHAHFCHVTHAAKFGTNFRNQFFSNNLVLNLNSGQLWNCNTRLFENNRFRKFVSTDWCPSELKNPGVRFFHTGVRRRKYSVKRSKFYYRNHDSFDQVYTSSSALPVLVI